MAKDETGIEGMSAMDVLLDDDVDQTQANEAKGQEGAKSQLPDQSSVLNQLMSDPDVRRVLELKTSGKKVFVSDTENKAEETEESTVESLGDELGLAKDDPARDLLSKLAPALDARDRKRQETLKELSARLQSVEALAGDVQKKEVVAQVEAVRSKYGDMKEYQQSMLELSKSNVGLSVEELYILSKLRSGKLKVGNTSTFSERPQNAPVKAPVEKKRSEPLPPGKKGFDILLSEALGSLSLKD